jgi:GMC oxidoreductase
VHPLRRAALRAAVETLAPPDARIERVTALAEGAIDGLSPQRSADLGRLLDLLAAPLMLPHRVREKFLLSLADSPVPLLRTGYAALKRLALFLAYAESASDSRNPTWDRLGYPGPRNDGAVEQPLPLSAARSGATLDADVIVIGSGAGGGVAAATFARAGRRVVVLEAGGAYSAQDFTQREISLADLYLERALAASADLGIVILAGATLGGGTTINWCTSFRLPDTIAAEWERESGIAGLGSELAPHFGALEEEMGVAPVERHNANNAVLADGCAALGMRLGNMPRNAARDCGDGCGYCGFGCAYAKKRSTVRAFLPGVIAAGGAV